MKRVIVKSVLITLCLLLAFIAVSIAVITAHFPMVVADLTFKVDNKKSCVAYTEKAYHISQDIGDLAILTERCIWADDNLKIIKYAEMLITEDGYDEFLLSKDGGYAYYIASEYVIALYDEGYNVKAVESAFQSSKGFEDIGPVHRLIATCNDKKDFQTLNAIKQKLLTYSGDKYADYLITLIDDALTKANT